MVQLPEEARELEKELRQITKEKNEAVRGQDFEKVLLLSFEKGLKFKKQQCSFVSSYYNIVHGTVINSTHYFNNG